MVATANPPSPTASQRGALARRRRLPAVLQRLDEELARRLRAADLVLNEYGFDPWGFHPERARSVLLPAAWLYRHWFRVQTYGIDRVPEGRVLLIANHAGQMGYDGVMLSLAMLLEGRPPRLCRGMGEFFLWKLPWLGSLVTAMGTVAGTPQTCAEVLEAEGCVMVFPEGARGANKPFRHRYRLQPFGQGFLRLALETGTPIVPVGIVGSEEQQPGLANLTGLASRLELPSLPITMGNLLFGPLGIAMALPVKYHVHFGEPLRFDGDASDEDAAMAPRVEEVRRAVGSLLEHGRRQRRGLFF